MKTLIPMVLLFVGGCTSQATMEGMVSFTEVYSDAGQLTSRTRYLTQDQATAQDKWLEAKRSGKPVSEEKGKGIGVQPEIEQDSTCNVNSLWVYDVSSGWNGGGNRICFSDNTNVTSVSLANYGGSRCSSWSGCVRSFWEGNFPFAFYHGISPCGTYVGDDSTQHNASSCEQAATRLDRGIN